MKSVKSEPKTPRFSDTTYAIPFGIYAASGESPPPSNEVLVGREGRRAYFIDLLINTGRQGAFLVTGRRGSGKTSFVNYCLDEYEASVHQRFFNSTVGRGILDRLGVLFLWLVILCGVLILSKWMRLLAPPEPGIIHWLTVMPPALLCLYPCLYAREVFEAIYQWLKQWFKQWFEQSLFPGPGFLATLTLIIVAILVWYTGPFGIFPLGLNRLFTAMGFLYFFVNLTSYSEKKAWVWFSRCLYAVASICIIFGLHVCPFGLDAAAECWIDLALGFWLLALGAGIHGSYQHARVRGESAPSSPLGFRKGAFADWVLAVVLVLIAAALFRWKIGMAGWRVMIDLVLSGILVPMFRWLFARRCPETWTVSREGCRFRARPLWIMAVKALLSIVIALQLAQPVLSSIPKPWGETTIDLQLVRWLQEGSLDSLYKKEPPSEEEPARSFEKEFLSVDDWHWLLALLSITVILYFIEYEWLIRPYAGLREDPVLNEGQKPPWREVGERLDDSRYRWLYRRLAELSFPWLVYRAWLPVIAVKVNLGFDKLDHHRVVQAMLAGLRDQYHRTFLAWNSGLANLGRVMGLLVLLLAVHLSAEAWFRSEPSELDDDPCTTVLAPPIPATSINQVGHADRLICRWGGEKLLHTLYSDIAFIGREGDAGIHLRVHHLFLFLAFFVAGRWLLRKVPFLPYAENLRRIDDLLESLSSRTTWTSRKNLWKPAQWVRSFFADESVRQTQRDPVDPRAVELAFLRILDEIQQGGVHLPGAARNHLSLPVPEITFIFDELDKLGTRVDDSGATRPRDIPHAERQRSLVLLDLLSDLKNLLSSAPARFIFVGARNLHDEWLADQTARQPLLSNIFNAEIYLPSLMLDHSRDKPEDFHYWVERYVFHQHKRADKLYRKWSHRRWTPLFGLTAGSSRSDSFVVRSTGELCEGRLEVWDCLSWKFLEDDKSLFIRNFISFLTYRSQGNPKRLQDLLASFVRRVERVVPNDGSDEHWKTRWEKLECRHVLQLDDAAVFRIQVLVELYRHVELGFEKRLFDRDDKLAISVFQMVDFILKFHRRAFSWRNLERADELVHTHQAPDLRLVVGELVEQCSERFLHRVNNGIYAFRFRSDLALEVEYISRQSPEEMAAFNFTLDELQSLKTLYSDMIRKSEEEVTHELVAGLGELHEFDQEYELARRYYRRAMHIVDEDLKAMTGHAPGDQSRSAVFPILHSKSEGPDYARRYMSWGMVRLRLMLQTGMTFELTRDLRRALAEYSNAGTLARTLLDAYHNRSDPEGADAEGDGHRLHELKQLNILFQPVFAEAWVLEKLAGSLDSGLALVEEELSRLRLLLPFVREPKLEPVTNPIRGNHSNFALILSQLHIKAGDLCFFKGRQAIAADKIPDAVTHETDESARRDRKGLEGYLLRAHYHYALGLHDLRRCLIERRLSSRIKLNIVKNGDRWETILRGKWPDLFSRVIGGAFDDVGEATLARVSFFGLLRSLNTGGYLEEAESGAHTSCESVHRQFVGHCSEWMEAKLEDEVLDLDLMISMGDRVFRLDRWGDWFGSPNDPCKENEAEFLSFEAPHRPEDRLVMAVHLCLAAADYLEAGGYPEDAAREFLQICETVTHYLWWGRGVEATSRWGRKIWKEQKWPYSVFEGEAEPFWAYLVEIAHWSLHKADELFRQSRRDEHCENVPYLVGDVIPPIAVTLACSLGLASVAQLTTLGQREKLVKLLHDWTEEEISKEDNEFVEGLRGLLENTLRRHSYPMINRLSGLKVLIDDAVLVEPCKTNISEVFERTLELLDLKENFKAPLHFTPLYSGITFAQVHLWAKSRNDVPDSRKRECSKIQRQAQRDLHTSEEMYTMRRAFYLAISDLYYLYDDFNDRQIHFNHALQMAGTEWAAVLAKLVE